MSNDHRRQLFVDREIQGRLALRILVHWVAFFVVSLTLTLMFHFLSDPLRPFGQTVSGVFKSHRQFLLIALVMIPAFVYDSVQVSNKFAGPILRFRRLVQEVGRKPTVERLNVREGDFWQELSKDFNQMLDRIEGRRTQPAAPRPSVAEAPRGDTPRVAAPRRDDESAVTKC